MDSHHCFETLKTRAYQQKHRDKEYSTEFLRDCKVFGTLGRFLCDEEKAGDQKLQRFMQLRGDKTLFEKAGTVRALWALSAATHFPFVLRISPPRHQPFIPCNGLTPRPDLYVSPVLRCPNVTAFHNALDAFESFHTRKPITAKLNQQMLFALMCVAVDGPSPDDGDRPRTEAGSAEAQPVCGEDDVWRLL